MNIKAILSFLDVVDGGVYTLLMAINFLFAYFNFVRFFIFDFKFNFFWLGLCHTGIVVFMHYASKGEDKRKWNKQAGNKI